jgi:cytochrome P450 PksS
VAFGFGLHFCLGAPLARLEAPIAVQLVLERMHRLQLATTTPNWMHHNLVRGLASLVVVF